MPISRRICEGHEFHSCRKAVFYYAAIFAIAGSVGLFFIPGKHRRSTIEA